MTLHFPLCFIECRKKETKKKITLHKILEKAKECAGISLKSRKVATVNSFQSAEHLPKSEMNIAFFTMLGRCVLH